MEMSELIIQFATKYGVYILGLFLLSEALALIPGIRENGVFQVVVKVLKGLKDAIKQPVTPVKPEDQPKP